VAVTAVAGFWIEGCESEQIERDKKGERRRGNG